MAPTLRTNIPVYIAHRYTEVYGGGPVCYFSRICITLLAPLSFSLPPLALATPPFSEGQEQPHESCCPPPLRQRGRGRTARRRFASKRLATHSTTWTRSRPCVLTSSHVNTLSGERATTTQSQSDRDTWEPMDNGIYRGILTSVQVLTCAAFKEQR